MIDIIKNERRDNGAHRGLIVEKVSLAELERKQAHLGISIPCNFCG